MLGAAVRARPRRRVPGRAVAALLLAAALAVVVLATWGGAGRAIARWLRPPAPGIAPDVPSPEWLAGERTRQRARSLRAAAHEDCAALRWGSCLRALDEARELDPTGESTDPAVREERRAAGAALQAAPPPSARDQKPRLDHR